MSETPESFRHASPGLCAIFICMLSWCVGLLGACGSCRDEPPAVATLIEVRGPGVERDFVTQIHQWQGAEVGARFGIGDGVRTGAQDSARLTLMDQTQIELARQTTLRFLIDGAEQGEQAFNIESGEVSLRVGQRDLMLRTQIGLAKVTAGSQLTLRRQGDNVDYDVALGEAMFKSSSGEFRVIKAGENLEVGIGMAVMSKAPPVVETEPEPAPVDSATLRANVKGKGVRSRVGEGEWQRLEAGEHDLAAGTELTLLRGDRVEISRGDQRAELRTGEYVVGSGDALVEARAGELGVTTASKDVLLNVPGGTIIVRARDGAGQASVKVDEDGGKLAVKRGASSVDVYGKQSELLAGQQQSWVTPGGKYDKTVQPGVEYFNLSARAGESFVLHAPEVPVAVRFDFSGRCPHEGVIELVGPKLRARGKDQVSVVVPALASPYVLRCLDEKGSLGKTVARGTVQVMKDEGTRRLPSKAPTSYVEADGRTYTIYYQNQLPEISVRWPNAPQSAQYDLLVDGQPIRVSQAEHAFRSGSLRDGTHQLSFQAGDRRSRTTVVEVRFDNAAPKASLTSPSDRGFKPGDTVTIEGVALETWKVSVEGGNVTMDADDRFVGEVASNAQRPDIAVRLAHPRLGVHYYLRRAASSQ
jgi:ferric-dicitrate binding protein FerR (iron transport regulator)